MNYAIWWFVQPSHLLVFFTIAGLAVRFFNQRLACRLLLVSAGCWLVVMFGPLDGLLLRPLEQRFPVPELDHPPAGILMLAGAERVTLSAERDQPHVNDLSGRLFTFSRLASSYPDAALIFAGGGPDPDVAPPYNSQNAIARSLLAVGGISERVQFDDQATSTCSSARTTAPMIAASGGGDWLLVTSAFHMPRAMACFRAVGLELIPYPTDFHQVPDEWWSTPTSRTLPGILRTLDLAAHEWVGLAYYRLRGLTNELFPAPRQPPVKPDAAPREPLSPRG